MVKTLEELEAEVAGSLTLRLQMKLMMDQLRAAEKKIGKDPLKIILLGYRKLTFEEYELAAKKFGVNAVNALSAMERLSIPQKQYIFKQMGWPIEEVTQV